MSLYQDAAGTIPALLPGDPVGLVTRAAGTVNAAQATQASKPTLGRNPKGGVRNLATGVQNVASTSRWPPSTTGSGLTSTKVGYGIEDGVPYVDYWITGTSTGTNIGVTSAGFSFGVGAKQGDTYTSSATARIIAGGIGTDAGLRLASTERDAEGSNGAYLPEPFNSTSDQLISRTFTCVDPDTDRLGAFFQYLTAVGSVVDVTYRIKGWQVEKGASVTPLQLNMSDLDVTEAGVTPVWFLWNDGGDSMPVTLPAGDFGLAWVDALGAVTVTTVTSDGTTPINLLRTTRMADVLIRQGALSTVEVNEMTTYWEGLYK